MNSSIPRFIAIVCLLVLSTSAKAASAGAPEPVVGKWSWGGALVVEFWQNGHVRSYPPVPVEGQWSLVSRGGANRERKYTISWNGGQFIDTLNMSMDHQHLYGQNQVGWRISAMRMSGGGEASESSATVRSVKERNRPAETGPTEKGAEDAADKTPSAAEKAIPAGVVARSATIVVADPDSALGDIKVTFADGQSEIMTKGGKCSLPHVSSSGDVGWDRPDKVTSDRYGRNADILHVRLHDGTIKEFKPNVLFIMEWGFASHDTEVVIKSMAHHGPSSFIKYNIKTGRATGEVQGYRPEAELPKWAQPFGE